MSALVPGIYLLYLFTCKTDVFLFQNSPKNPDPSYKMDLDFWDCFEKENTIIY